jgi:hypothetical protein
MIESFKIEFPTKCPICGKDTYISKDDYACSNKNCKLSIGNKAYFKNFLYELQDKIYSEMGIPQRYL